MVGGEQHGDAESWTGGDLYVNWKDTSLLGKRRHGGGTMR